MGRIQRDMGLHRVVVDTQRAITHSGKRLVMQASDELASTMLLTGFHGCDPSATAKPWRNFSEAARLTHAGDGAVVLALDHK